MALALAVDHVQFGAQGAHALADHLVQTALGLEELLPQPQLTQVVLVVEDAPSFQKSFLGELSSSLFINYYQKNFNL